MKQTTNRFASELETAYRQYYLKADSLQLFLGVVLWMVSFVGFAFADYLLFGRSQGFWPLLGLRLAYGAGCAWILTALRGQGLTPARYDAIALGWGIVTVAVNLGIGLLRPRGDLSLLIIALVAVFSFYVFISGSMLRRVIPALLMTVVALAFSTFIKAIEGGQVMLALAFSLTITNLVGVIFSRHYYDIRRAEFLARQEEAQARAELLRLASTDPLTGVYNRRRLLELAGEALYRQRRYGRPFSIIVMDLDGFKTVNDTFGHHQGDAVLVQFAAAITEQKREGDALGRMGGDEFCLLLPETDPQAAAVLAARILEKCGNIHLEDTLHNVHVTTSIGISHAQAGDASLDPVFARADAALYKAKNKGRNRYEIA
jgi:diguanylate cyclase (GGDEF)-like protein